MEQQQNLLIRHVLVGQQFLRSETFGHYMWEFESIYAQLLSRVSQCPRLCMLAHPLIHCLSSTKSRNASGGWLLMFTRSAIFR